MKLSRSAVWIVAVGAMSAASQSWAVEAVAPAATCLRPADDFFLDEVWAKVGSQSCLTCHKAGGDAEASRFVLQDPQRVQGPLRDEAARHNREAFAQMARSKTDDGRRLLVKARGGLDHGGGQVLAADASGYRVLEEFVRRVDAPHTAPAAPSLDPAQRERDARPFFAGVTMVDDRRLARRFLLSLAGRLPTAAELADVDKRGRAALVELLDAALHEEAFYTRLREGFNDIFLTVGFTGNPDQSVLSYEYFTKTRGWTQKHDLTKVGDENAQRQARYKLADDYRKALREEATYLVDYIVRNDRPFTELVTADYILVTPYSARGYGIFDEVRDQFKNPDDPFEYVPVRLKALEGRSPRTNQESATGFYPHAGMLSTFQYLRRYPTTETNRNRLRARMYYQHFLGVDALELAARVADAAAVTEKYEIPTMQAAECVVCHKTIDPVAGLFQDYYEFEGTYGRRKEGWYKDMFAAGFEGEELPEAERWRALQWLGERTAADPRFATTMVEHVYYVLTGRRVLLPPKDIDDPLYAARRRAYNAQRCEVETIAARFAAGGFGLRDVFRDWVFSDFYRVDGLASAVDDAERLAELDDLGLAHMLSPEQLNRKLVAIFGDNVRRLSSESAMLYGGIDSQEVTERAADPSGAMGALQRTVSNDTAMRNVLRDFTLPHGERRLFPHVEPDVLPGASAEADAAIRRNIVYLHDRILGRADAADSADVERTYGLFRDIVADAAAVGKFEQREIYSARSGVDGAPDDPHYTIRAWRAVVTYLLRRQEFLYE